MQNMNLELARESLAQVVEHVRTAEDVSVSDLSAIVLATLTDQLGETLAEQMVAAYSGELADLIFEPEVLDIPEPASSDALEQYKKELAAHLAQARAPEEPALPEDQSDQTPAD